MKEPGAWERRKPWLSGLRNWEWPPQGLACAEHSVRAAWPRSLQDTLGRSLAEDAAEKRDTGGAAEA